MNRKTYFITGGGTGGHIYPAIAVADGLLKEETTEKVYYVGNPNNLEASITKEKEYEFLPVLSSGMPRKITFRFIKWFIEMMQALVSSVGYIRKYKPDVIFGTGGYVSAPVILGGVLCGVPIIMHDCDANPGLVTRGLAPLAKSISIAFEAAKIQLKNKNCYVNGNPIRAKFKTLSKEDAQKSFSFTSEKLTLCVMGGSQGAKSINNATVSILEKLVNEYNIQVIFQTGKKNYDDIKAKLDEKFPNWSENKNLVVKPYFEDMVSVLKSSDIAVSRAGSLSISELCASSVAPIFVPYPYAAADHQRKNAKCMEKNGAGLYIEDSQLNEQTLLNMITDLLNNREKLKTIQDNAQKLAVYDATSKIIEQIKKVV